MGANPNGRINEGIIANFPIQEKDNYFLQVSQSICKIKTNLQFGTGFFMKIPVKIPVYSSVIPPLKRNKLTINTLASDVAHML